MAKHDPSKEKMLLYGLASQIEMQISFVNMARRDLQRTMNQTPKPGMAREIFYAIQNLLNASGNISKALWGQRGVKSPHYTRRKPLREVLGLDDTSPLYPLLDVRNGFEHYDQRLTEWIDATSNPFIVDSNIGDELKIFRPPRTPLRHYNPATGIVRFLDHEYHLPSVVQEIERIAPLLEAEMNKRSGSLLR